MRDIIIDDAYQICQIINNMPFDQLRKCENIINIYLNSLKGQSEDIIQLVAGILKENRQEDKAEAYIYLSSIVINLTLESEDLIELEKYLLNNMELDAAKKYFVYYQIKILMFCHKSLITDQTLLFRWKLCQQVVEMYKKLIKTELKYIPTEERDENFVLVITDQFLTTEHGPTKTALDRCRTLIKQKKNLI